MGGRRRVAVVEDADRMSNESSNALLKTLEEPPPYAVIVLVAADGLEILPTIRSRCQTVRFGPLEAEEIARLACELGWTDNQKQAEAAAVLSEGSLATARQLLNPELSALRGVLIEGLSRPRLESDALTKRVLAALDALGGDSHAQRAAAQWVVRFVVDYFRHALRQWIAAPGDPAVPEGLGRAIDRCAEAGEQLAGNAAIPLCLEALFSDLAGVGSAVL